VKEAWKMRFIPASEAAREVYERIAREEGKSEGRLEGKLEGVRTVMEALMKMGLPADQVAREIGLSDEKFHDLLSER
jgi:predicted transposase/invertase (TIGR01784 family)